MNNKRAKKIFILTLNVLVFLIKYIILILLSFIFIIILFYFNTIIYDYPKTKIFSGDSLYNPYQNFKGKSIKANFHAHTTAWGKITNGANSDSILFNKYKKHNYQFIGISNYLSIDTFAKTQKHIFIPIYEHGYNVWKAHRLSIGSNKVYYFDYPFYQSASHKQKIIDNLKNNKAIVALAHPEFFDGLSYEDMQKLCHYDLIEVLNHYRISENHWDVALSAGRLSFLIANDDTHDIFNETSFRLWNNIFSHQGSELDSTEILKSLVAGRNYGINSNLMGQSDNYLKSLQIKNDTIFIQLNTLADKIDLIGQDGVIKKSINNANYISYHFLREDTYIRTVAYNKNSTLYLNPVVRYNGKKLPLVSQTKASANVILTVLFILVVLCVEIILFWVIQKIVRTKIYYKYY